MSKLRNAVFSLRFAKLKERYHKIKYNRSGVVCKSGCTRLFPVVVVDGGIAGFYNVLHNILRFGQFNDLMGQEVSSPQILSGDP